MISQELADAIELELNLIPNLIKNHNYTIHIKANQTIWAELLQISINTLNGIDSSFNINRYLGIEIITSYNKGKVISLTVCIADISNNSSNSSIDDYNRAMGII